MKDTYDNDLLTSLTFLITLCLTVFVIIWIISDTNKVGDRFDDRPVQVKTETITKTEVVEVPVVKYKYVPMVKCLEVPYTPDERELLAAMVHAEAGNQDQVGKRLIVDVILNRVDSDIFPNSVKEVVKQSGQFTKPSYAYTADDLKAVDAELNERLDYNILYFRTNKFHSCGSPAFQHGDHYFSSVEGNNEKEND